MAGTSPLGEAASRRFKTRGKQKHPLQKSNPLLKSKKPLQKSNPFQKNKNLLQKSSPLLKRSLLQKTRKKK